MTLKQLIQASGLKQSYIASNIGVTETVLSNLVRGRRKLLISDLPMLETMAVCLGCLEDEIIAAYDETRRTRCSR
jgi:transcriptional regulator with XRE-family HTH domain